MAPSIELLDAAGAQSVLDSLQLPCVPATLHPAYVVADSVRDRASEPAWLHFRAQGQSWLNGVLLRSIAGTRWRDASSPYGYGGPVATSAEAAFVAAAWQAYEGWMRDAGVVVEYVRFHPLMANERFYGARVEDNRTVVSIALDEGDVVQGYETRLRQVLRKAQRAALRYDEFPLAQCCTEFAEYHRAAMREMGADGFYVFDDDYFAELARSGLARVGTCRAAEGDAWLAACLLLDGRGACEYHLAATTAEGRRRAASSFALHGAATHAQQRGVRDLYLGGGTDRRADNPLLFFKGAFSRKRLAYRTGSCVFLPDAYQKLQGRFAREWQTHPERPIFYRTV
jgi:hypothetical protein